MPRRPRKNVTDGPSISVFGSSLHGDLRRPRPKGLPVHRPSRQAPYLASLASWRLNALLSFFAAFALFACFAIPALKLETRRTAEAKTESTAERAAAAPQVRTSGAHRRRRPCRSRDRPRYPAWPRSASCRLCRCRGTRAPLQFVCPTRSARPRRPRPRPRSRRSPSGPGCSRRTSDASRPAAAWGCWRWDRPSGPTRCDRP